MKKMGFKFRYIKNNSDKIATVILNFENISSIIIVIYLKFDLLINI